MGNCKVVSVFDLGPGDGGKGGVVHKLCEFHNAHTVIKVGGAQGSHGVTHGDKKFAFSQWGCGTFSRVPTFISSRMVISPEGLINEANALVAAGVEDPFKLLTVDRDCTCATPYHGIASRFKELFRGKSPRGTIGTGVGEAHRDSTRYNDVLVAYDLKHSELVENRMRLVRDRVRRLVDEKPLLESVEDEKLYQHDLNLLNDDGFLEWNVDHFLMCGEYMQLAKQFALYHDVLQREGTAIVESSHGILTDSWCGFAPHTSALRTLPIYTERMLRGRGFKGEIEHVGVHRAYTVRHGAGPMPTADSTLNEALLPGSCKEENRWQGKIRVGALDFMLLKYAIDVVQKDTKIDSLAISWFDQVMINGRWDVCDRYAEMPNEMLAPLDYRIRTDAINPTFTEELTKVLFRSRPEITSIDLPDSMEDRFRLCNDEIEKRLGIPVSLVSFGPTRDDKYMRVMNHV